MTEAAVRQPLRMHLQELRRRLLWVVAIVGAGSLAGFVGRRVVVEWLKRPLHQPLFYNSPAGGFDFTMRVSLLVGVVLALPFLIYHLIKFIQPALSKTVSRRALVILFGLSVALAAAGLVFAYSVVVPMSLRFFASFSSLEVKPLISARDYLGFVTACLTTFAVIFQLPLLLLFIDRITPLPPRRLMRYQRHVVIGSLAVALILPFTYDPLTQFVIAVPIIGLYELSILLLWLVHLPQRRRVRVVATDPLPARPIEKQPQLARALGLSPRTLDLSQIAAESESEMPMSRYVTDTRPPTG